MRTVSRSLLVLAGLLVIVPAQSALASPPIHFEDGPYTYSWCGMLVSETKRVQYSETESFDKHNLDAYGDPALTHYFNHAVGIGTLTGVASGTTIGFFSNQTYKADHTYLGPYVVDGVLGSAYDYKATQYRTGVFFFEDGGATNYESYAGYATGVVVIFPEAFGIEPYNVFESPVTVHGFPLPEDDFCDLLHELIGP